MLKREFYATRHDGVNLYRTFSDEGKYIQKEGDDFLYEEAVDEENAGFVYEETDERIPEQNLGDMTDEPWEGLIL